MNLLIPVVNFYDNIIGYDTKENIHNKGILHRAFSVFLYNKNGLIIQKRDIAKYHSGGLWANSCCSHPYNNENIIQAACRRLNEELGILSAPKLHSIGSIMYREVFSTAIEFEKDRILVGEYNGHISCDKAEIEYIKTISFDDLTNDVIENPQSYACWFIIALPMVLEHIKNSSNGR